MCGIAGFWDFNKKSSRENLFSITQSLIHRGPDDYGFYFDENFCLGLGHRRLAIIDLTSSGKQPMTNESQTLWIIYNGEVYNFKEIRKELGKKNYRFNSKSDTEVVLKSFEEYGITAVKKFIGMFAFSIWDKKNEKLYLCRDRLGVKPLYYYFKNDVFIFASELKAILRHPLFSKKLNYDGLYLYLQKGYVPSPFSIFEDIYKLPPGCYLQISSNKEIKIEKYWEVFDFFLDSEINKKEEEIEEELENLLKKSCSYRMIADVPIGVFLSGGIDSTLITAIIQKQSTKPLQTFTIKFPEKKFDESQWAKKIAIYLKTGHTEIECSPLNSVEIIEKISQIYDEPFADSSAIPTYLISKEAKFYIKTVLSGDGGDELFCGYTHYPKFSKLYKKLLLLPKKQRDIISKCIDFFHIERFSNTLKHLFPFYNPVDFQDKIIKLKNILKTSDFPSAYNIFSNFWLEEDIKHLVLDEKFRKIPTVEFGNIPEGIDFMKLMFMIDYKSSLSEGFLVKVDRASMAVSLELREPLLDHSLVEYCARIPLRYKYCNGISKYLLKKILFKYVPEKLLNRPKRGFSIPLEVWLKKELKNLIKEHLNPEKIKKEGFFNCDFLQRKLAEFYSDKPISPKKIWNIFMFELWYEKWLQ